MYIYVYHIWQESNFRIFQTSILSDNRETNFGVEDPIIANLESRDAKATTCRSRKLDKNGVCASSQEAIWYSFFANGQRGKVGTFRSCSEANCSCSWHRAFPGERVDFTDKSLINRIICTRIVVPVNLSTWLSIKRIVCWPNDEIMLCELYYGRSRLLELGYVPFPLIPQNRSNIDVCRLKLNHV